MLAKIFLTLTGLMYIWLSIWCTVSPQQTSGKLGLELKSGSGQSEFLVIYGGWELAMAVLFLLPLLRPEWLHYSLVVCIVMHGCLVAYRTASFFMFSDISGTTRNLAIGEWVILLLAVGLWFFTFWKSGGEASA